MVKNCEPFRESRSPPEAASETKAKAILSAFHLAQRLAREALPEAPLLDTPDRVADLLRKENRLYQVEQLQIALVNTRRRLIRLVKISMGTLDTLLARIFHR